MGRHWSEEEARAALDELSRTSLSEAAFARSKGVSKERLRFWRKRFAARSAHGRPAFVAVELPSAAAPRVADAGSAGIEMVVGNVALRVPTTINIETLADLVTALNRRRVGC